MNKVQWGSPHNCGRETFFFAEVFRFALALLTCKLALKIVPEGAKHRTRNESLLCVFLPGILKPNVPFLFDFGERRSAERVLWSIVVTEMESQNI